MGEHYEHYANNPDVLAFCVDDQIVDQVSYDEMARWDFIAWLKRKYATIENLSTAWGGAFLGYALMGVGPSSGPLERRDTQSQNGARLSAARQSDECVHSRAGRNSGNAAPGKPTTHNGSICMIE